MANDKSFKIKNGLSATRYYGSAGTETAGANGPYGTFDTTLYTGNASARTITNNIDLSTDGGLVWLKARSTTGHNHLADTERGGDKWIYSNLTQGQDTVGYITSFNSDGFSLSTSAAINASGTDYVAWTFKQASNFFDVVTYTGDGTTSRSISHNLGSAPGSIFIKQTSGSGENWIVWHRSISNQVSGEILYLNATDSKSSMNGKFDDTNLPTSTTFTVEQDNSVNASGASYVAYLFAHDTSADGYIQCGSFTTDGTGKASVELGWEPSWILTKRVDSSGNWAINDSPRGMPSGKDTAGSPYAQGLFPNLTNAEGNWDAVSPFATGFNVLGSGVLGNNATGIYMAIRAVVQTQTLDLSTGHTFSITPTVALDVLFSNPPASGVATAFTVEVNNSAGGYALTWPSSVKWHLGTAPTATASKEVYTFITTDGGTTYYGKKAGENLA